MKLKSVRLHPFGRFNDESLSFDGSLVVIHGPNELGKTTIRQAIVHALFTPTNQTPAQFRDTMDRWLPRPAGDHAVVTLVFEHEGVSWTLAKRWGAGASSRLTDGTTVLGDAATVQNQLGNMLAHNEATFRHVLFTGQAELEQTLAALQDNASSLRDIRDLLRAGAGAAGDVDEQQLRRRLDERIEKAFGRWNDARDRPEPQNGQEKGIANRWKRGTGTILEAWYAWQELVAERDAVLELERSIDDINALVAEQKRLIAAAADFLQQYGHLRGDIAERNVLEERLARREGQAKALGDAFRAWPVAEAAIQAWPARRRELETTRDTLQAELKNAERRRDGAATRDAFRALEAAKFACDQAVAAALAVPDPGRERVDAVDALCASITAAENKLAARRLAWRIEAQTPGRILLERGMESAESITLGQEAAVGTAEARVRLVADGITLTVDSGGDDVDALFRSLTANRTRLTEELRACNATSRDDLALMVAKRRDAEAVAAQRKAAFAGALGGKTFAQWEEAIRTLDDLPHARDVTTITTQMNSVCTQLITEQNQVHDRQTSIDGWTKAYTSQEELQDTLLEVKADLKGDKERHAALATLPEGFDSPQTLLARLDEAQQSRLTAQEQLADVRARCAELSTQLGDRRSQDLAEAADTAARTFERARAEGRSYRRIRQELDRITANPETDPLQPFGEKVAAVFSRITGSEVTLAFTGQLPAQVVRGAVSLPPERLSHGGGGALALAIRLAMAEAYLAIGGGFLMFDDPLVHFDPQRMAIATQVLREVSEAAQIIFFTCHDHHAERFRT